MSKEVWSSTGLADYINVQGSRRDALTGHQLVIYQGVVPGDADDLVDFATAALVVIAGPAGDIGLRFENTSVAGSIAKAAAQVWSGNATATGTATFFRLEKPTDTHGASTTDIRLQGRVGAGDANLNMQNVNITSGQNVPIPTFFIGHNRRVFG